MTAADSPLSVQCLLKTYEPSELSWARDSARYEVVVAVLTRGCSEARQWLRAVLMAHETRELIRQFRGTGCAEPVRAELRRQLNLTVDDIPHRSSIPF